MTVELTMALERYDRHVPFFMDMVKNPEGIRIKSLEVVPIDEWSAMSPFTIKRIITYY